MPTITIFRHILIGLSVIVLACAFKNYLASLLNGSFLCEYICPSAFGWQSLDTIPVFQQLFTVQEWVHSTSQELADSVYLDQRNLFSMLIAVPVVEELIYRGPMYLTKNHSKRIVWWVVGVVLAIVFAVSHGRSGISLLPLLVLGIYNLWLIAETKRIWPAITLHFLYNFIILSFAIYPSIWSGD